jgi:MFS family permease
VSEPATGSRRDLGWLLALIMVSTCTQAVRPAASYRALELGGSAAAVGAVAAAFALLSVFAAIPIGLAIDRLGPKRFLVGGVGLLASSSLLCAASDSIVGLGIAQGLVGLGQVSFVLAIQSIVANRTDKDAGFARITVAGGSGQLAGPMLAGLLVGSTVVGASLTGATKTFLVGAALAAIGVVLAMAASRTLPDSTPEHPMIVRSSLRAIAGSSGLGQALFTSIVTSTSIEMMVTYLPVLGTARGISPAVIGTVLAIRAVSGLASRVVMTRMLARLGRRGLLIASLVAAGAAMLGIAFSHSIWLLVVLSVVVGFGLAVGAPLTMTLVAARVPRGTRAAAMAVRITGDRVGLLTLAVLLGGLASVFGAGTVFVAVSATLLGSAGWVRSTGTGFEV